MSVRFTDGPMSRSTRPRATQRIAVLVGAALFTASCTSMPVEGPRSATGLPPHLDTDAGQVLRYCLNLREKGNLPIAAGLCQRAHQLDPENPAPLMQLAGIMTDMGELNLALAAYRTILNRDPDHVEAHYGMGRTYVSLGQNDLALGEFRAALRGDPNDPRLYNAVGVADGLLGAHAAAQEVFRAGLKKDSSNITLRNNLGLSLVLSGRYAEGLQILEAVAADPNADRTSQENLHLAQGLYAKARADNLLAAATNSVMPESDSADDFDVNTRIPANETTQEALIETAPDTQARPQPSRIVDRPHRLARALAQREDSARRTSTAETNRAEAETRPTPLTGAFAQIPGTRSAPRAPAPHATRAPVPGISQTARSGVSDFPETIQDDDASGPGFTFGPDDHVVQFASYSSAERARLGWKILMAAAPDLLRGRTPDIQRADLGAERGIFYRLRSQPEPETSARHLCDSLTERKIDCLVLRLSSDELANDATAKKSTATNLANASIDEPAYHAEDKKAMIEPDPGFQYPTKNGGAGGDMPPLP